MQSLLRIFFAVCLVLGLLPLGGCATGPTYPPSSLSSLVETLRAGGNVIYMRHVTADVGRDVQGTGEWWKKCGEGHRMLSDKGRADAVLVGEAIRRLRIPISQVYCSEYCRAVETARLLSLGDPKTDARLNGWPAWKAVDPERGLQRLSQGTTGASGSTARSGKRVARLAQTGLSRSNRFGARRPQRWRMRGLHPRWAGGIFAPRSDQGGRMGIL